jgi:hypothetical protein
MNGARIQLVFVSALALCACKSTSSERPAELETEAHDRAEPPPPAAVKPHEPAPVKLADDSEPPSALQLPVAEDFQAETATAIVRSNYRRELEALETELRADEN